jgi:carboxypeptidase C (cathepsin A)
MALSPYTSPQLPRCKKWLKEGCVDHFDKIDCDAAVSFCSQYLEDPFFTSGSELLYYKPFFPNFPDKLAVDRNPYDISRPCEGDISETLCYPVTKCVTLQLGSKALFTFLSRYIASYLDRPEVRALLGVDTLVNGNFNACSNRVGTDFSNNLDEYRPTQHYVAALLERNVNVLIYVGKYDWICNHVGNEAWTLNLEWSGHDEFSTQSLREWKVDGKPAGMTRSAQGLTFATIEGAGHMVR